MSDDPINPKHYAGTLCAEIGEQLTANSYQVLKYIWRLNKKDAPAQELGKAIWYLDRELELSWMGWRPPATLVLPTDSWFHVRYKEQSDIVQAVAINLIGWNRHGDRQCLHILRHELTLLLEHWEALPMTKDVYDAKAQLNEDLAKEMREAIAFLPKGQDILQLEKIQDYRFASLIKGKHYAFARGLTINPTHLPAALDAMHKDGFELMSIFGDTTTEKMGFIFRIVNKVAGNKEIHAAWEDCMNEYQLRTGDNLK